MDPSKCIPANPDISGIGVRIAIYAQNLLCFLPIIFYLYDGEISLDELAGIQDQSIGMLAIAFAILITTASLAAGPNATVTNYHAAIILDLSWMNNTSTWIWFILHVYERSTAKYKPVGATWSGWRTALWSPVRTYLHGQDPAGSHDSGTWATTQGGENDEKERTRMQKAVQHFWSSRPIRWLRAVCRPVWWSKPMIYLRRFARLVVAAPVLTLGSTHLSLMSAIGIWLWQDPAGFGLPINRCTPMLTVFGTSVSFKSTPLRIFSLTMYSLLLIPGLNLLPPFAFFLFLHISYNHVRTRIHTVLGRKERKGKEREAQEHGKATSTPADTRVRTAFLYIGLSCLVFVNILFIVDTELTLQRNKDKQDDEERDWGFGQILALLLLLVPLRDAWIALRNIQNSIQQRFEQAFRTVAEAKMARDDLSKLLRNGANPGQQIPGRFGHFLQLAAYYGNEDLIKLLIPEGHKNAIVDAIGGDYGTALQAAAARGHKATVQYLLGVGADPNVTGGDYGSALCAACANGHREVVNILLGDMNIEKNIGSRFGAPLHIAVLQGEQSIIEALVEDEAQTADCKWQARDMDLKAMDIAVLTDRKEIWDILKEKGLTAVRCGRTITCSVG